MASVAKRNWTHEGQSKSAWVVRYKDVAGVHRSKQFGTKKEADTHKRLVERELEDGVHVADAETKTLKAVAEEYLVAQDCRVKQGNIGRGRYSNICKAINQSILPRLGGRIIRDIKPSAVEDWFQCLLTIDKLAPATAKARFDELRQIFRFALRRGYLKTDTAAAAQIGRVARTKVDTFTLEQVQLILDEVEKRPRRYHQGHVGKLRLLVHLAVFCGLRMGEIRALRVRHLNLSAGVVHVRESLSDLDGFKAPKSAAGVRDVPLPKHLVDRLQEALAGKAPTDLLLATASGLPLPMATVRSDMWYPLLKRCGLWNEAAGANGERNQFHFHALRHFASSMMIAEHMPLPDVASLLGHSNFDLTLKVYAHPMIGGNQRGAALQGVANRVLLPGPVTQGVRTAA